MSKGLKLSRRFSVVLGTMLGLCACSLTPHYEVPTSAITVDTHSADWIVAIPQDDQARGEWWLAFHDDGLNRLEMQFKTDSQALKSAMASLTQIRAQVKAAQSLLLPSVSINSAASRSRSSINGPSFSASRGAIYDDFSANAAVSYEFDLFGRVRSAYSGVKAQAQASRGDIENVILVLRTQVAISYFTIHALDGEIASLTELLDLQQKAFAQAKRLYEGGAFSKGDLNSAELQLAAIRSLVAEAHLKRTELQDALALLIGADPLHYSEPVFALSVQTNNELEFDFSQPQRLQRRPDIAAAERRVYAANAAIGNARAAYFPVLDLTGFLGRESMQQGTWWTAPSALWSGAAQGSVFLFDAGRRKATIDAAHAAYDQAVANYRQTVLNALGDLNDQWATHKALMEERAASIDGLNAASSNRRLIEAKFQVGTVTAIDRAQAMSQLSSATITALDCHTRYLANQVNLIRVFGGL